MNISCVATDDLSFFFTGFMTQQSRHIFHLTSLLSTESQQAISAFTAT